MAYLARAFAGEEGDKADTADDVALVGSGPIASNYFNELLATAPLVADKILILSQGDGDTIFVCN